MSPSPSSIVRLLLALLLTAAAALVAAPAHASARPAAAGRCAPIEATGTGQDLGNGQTTATVSVDGQVVGTTRATFTITGS